MFRVVLEEVGSGVVNHVTTYSIVHIPLIYKYVGVCLEFPSGVQVYRQPRRHTCEGQAISQHS